MIANNSPQYLRPWASGDAMSWQTRVEEKPIRLAPPEGSAAMDIPFFPALPAVDHIAMTAVL